MDIPPKIGAFIVLVVVGLLQFYYVFYCLQTNKVYHPFYRRTVTRAEDPFWFWAECLALLFVSVVFITVGFLFLSVQLNLVSAERFSEEARLVLMTYFWSVVLIMGGAASLGYCAYAVVRGRIMMAFRLVFPFRWMRMIHREAEPILFWLSFLVGILGSIFLIGLGCIMLALL